jgi:hypothetical protein
MRLLKVAESYFEVVIVKVVEAYRSSMSPCTYHLNEYNREALIQNVWCCCYCVYLNEW